MYLLTWWRPHKGGPYAQSMHFAHSTREEAIGFFEDAMTRPSRTKEPELFERRGNDWIRIRPEEDADA